MGAPGRRPAHGSCPQGDCPSVPALQALSGLRVPLGTSLTWRWCMEDEGREGIGLFHTRHHYCPSFCLLGSMWLTAGWPPCGGGDLRASGGQPSSALKLSAQLPVSPGTATDPESELSSLSPPLDGTYRALCCHPSCTPTRPTKE